MRPLLRRWLLAHGAGEDEIYDITVAVQEACANAVEHAYAPGAATYDVEASVDGRRGALRRPRPWPLARAARNASRARNHDDASADGVGGRHTTATTGTVVVLRRTLGRPAP